MILFIFKFSSYLLNKKYNNHVTQFFKTIFSLSLVYIEVSIVYIAMSNNPADFVLETGELF